MKTSEDSISIDTAISEAWVAKLYEQLSDPQWIIKELIVLTEKRKLLSESDYVKNQDTIMAISELLKKQI